MKTTVVIPETLLRQAKAKAAERGIPLRQFVTEAVTEKLGEEVPADKPWMKMCGGLAHLRKETARIQGLIDAEFETIDAEDGG